MNRFLVALDSSPIAASVLKRASVLAKNAGAEMVLVRAVAVPTELPTEVFIEPPARLGEIMQRRAERELSQLVASVPEAKAVAQIVRVGAPWQVICDVAREQNVDLIIVGARGYGLIDRLVGTTASKVVNHADRSVMVIR